MLLQLKINQNSLLNQSQSSSQTFPLANAFNTMHVTKHVCFFFGFDGKKKRMQKTTNLKKLKYFTWYEQKGLWDGLRCDKWDSEGCVLHAWQCSFCKLQWSNTYANAKGEWNPAWDKDDKISRLWHFWAGRPCTIIIYP